MNMNFNIPFVDNFLNKITMYRLALYHLCVLWAVALAYTFFGVLSFSPLALLFSTVVVLAVCWVANEVFAWAWKVTPNVESVYITAFIVMLIMTPVTPSNFYGASLLAVASAAAMASKFLLVWGRQHIFNPAAFGVALTGIAFGSYASWWVAGNVWLLPFVAIGGLLLVRKVQRFDMFWTFAVVSAAGVCISFLPLSPLESLQDFIVHSSAIFLATVMLTEPFTSPITRAHRMVYAAIVGFFFIPHIHIGSFYTSPELALLLGNLYTAVVMPKSRRILTLVETKQIAEGIYDCTFRSDAPLAFHAGQYLEWTLGHSPSDSRGNRRYFTIASSPTESELHLGIKTYDPSSSFKKALLALQTGQTISVGNLSGEFTLPKNKAEKVAFIAGGIGITPFRSMVQYMMDTEARDAVLLYSTKTPAEVAYKEVFDMAHAKMGMKTYYSTMLDKDALMREVPDYNERTFYLSGPRGMVMAFEGTLKSLGVPSRKIKIDFFPGFV
jgi:ferredoxin-NADP reductase/Na+-transporting NADH:ubiquinone oxidoreductase subunit NqrB